MLFIIELLIFVSCSISIVSINIPAVFLHHSRSILAAFLQYSCNISAAFLQQEAFLKHSSSIPVTFLQYSFSIPAALLPKQHSQRCCEHRSSASSPTTPLIGGRQSTIHLVDGTGKPQLCEWRKYALALHLIHGQVSLRTLRCSGSFAERKPQGFHAFPAFSALRHLANSCSFNKAWVFSKHRITSAA